MAYRSFVGREQNISPSFGEFTAPLRHILPIYNVTISSNNLFVNFPWPSLLTEHTSHLAGLWIGAAIQTRLTQTKSVLPLSNEHGSQVKDQGRRQCCHNKHKISLHVLYLSLPNTPFALASLGLRLKQHS